MGLTTLPNELVQQVVSELPHSSIAALAQTSKRMAANTAGDVIWAPRVVADFSAEALHDGTPAKDAYRQALEPRELARLTAALHAAHRTHRAAGHHLYRASDRATWASSRYASTSTSNAIYLIGRNLIKPLPLGGASIGLAHAQRELGTLLVGVIPGLVVGFPLAYVESAVRFASRCVEHRAAVRAAGTSEVALRHAEAAIERHMRAFSEAAAACASERIHAAPDTTGDPQA